MQLIVDSEAALEIKRDMSAIEEIHTEKVVNGDIEQLLKTCNGNKENIEEFNVITNDEKNKQVLNSEIEALHNLPMDVQPENTEEESSSNKEETCESIVPETNGKQNGESQSNGTDEECQSKISRIKREPDDEEETKKTVQEDIVEDIISPKQEPLDQIAVVSEIQSVKVETDGIKITEDLPGTKDDMMVLQKQTETYTTTGSIPDAVTEEAVSVVKLEGLTNTIKIDDNSLECSDNEHIPKESSDNEAITKESSDNKHIPKESSDNETITKESSYIEDIPKESSDNEGITKEASDNDDITKEASDNVHIPKESSDNEDLPKDESTQNKAKQNEIKVTVDNSTEGLSNNNGGDSPPLELKNDMDVEEVVETKKSDEQKTAPLAKETDITPVSCIKPIFCKLSNTLDILSDDEEEPPEEETPKVEDISAKQCINIEDDDDIMLIDEDTSKTEAPETVDISKKDDAPIKPEDKTDSETGEVKGEETIDLFDKTETKDETQPAQIEDDSLQISVSEKQKDVETNNFSPELPLLPNNFLNSAKNNLSDMTREELEEFCILKIVESIVDRSNLSEIKNKLKTVAQGVDEYRKKVMMLTKQNRDLQVVLKSIQEEQKKSPPGTPITPLKITRSVGMQVFMEKTGSRRKNLALLQNPNNNRQGTTKSLPGTNPRPQKPPASTQTIPVPRLVPASPAVKSPSTIPLVNQITPSKPAAALPNGIKPPSPSQKVGEKRQFNRTMSVTVDLTDDEPPTKINNRTSPAPPVRVVPSQNLMANPRQPFPTAVSSPRKVYIPISGPQNQNIRPAPTIMLKTVPTPGIRPRGPTPQVIRQPAGSVRMNRTQANRHPAPLPDAMKQYQPPNWKALPPAPELKLSKVENGIVISWKLEGYQQSNYEEIASYQIYAYQETSCPPSTSLWKKIGDVKALPLPMACTLTQFMAGHKYFFAVRAVDIRSRLGPFSLPGSIILLNKL